MHSRRWPSTPGRYRPVGRMNPPERRPATSVLGIGTGGSPACGVGR